MKLIKNNKIWILLISAILLGGIYSFAGNSKANTVNHLLASEFHRDIIKNKSNIILVDIRTPQEYNNGHIEGAELINFYDQNFMNEMQKLDKNSKIYIYCRSGRRTGIAAKIMEKEGFKNINNLKYGINSWLSEGYNLTK